MQTRLENNTLTIYLEGRIDSSNAPATEQALLAAVSEAPGANIAIDAEKLEYISSAGLRVLMKLRRQAKAALPVMNVSAEVYEIFEVTGFTELLEVQRKLRQVSVEGCELIGQGGNGSVYRLDAETILKLYNEGASLEKIALEKKYATAAFTAGLPCAIAYDTVRCGNRYGIVFELLNAVNVGKAVDRDPDLIPKLGRAMGELFRQLHTTELAAGTVPRMTEKLAGWIDYLEEKYIDPSDAALMRQVASAIPERNTLIHADFHEGNVMVQGEELILIDLDDICIGNPLYDYIGHYMSHVLAAKSAPEVVRLSMGMSVETAYEMYKRTLLAYMDTEDEARLAAHEQNMQLLSMFFMLVFLAKSKDSRNLTPERIQGTLAQVLPLFRQSASRICEVVSQYR